MAETTTNDSPPSSPVAARLQVSHPSPQPQRQLNVASVLIDDQVHREGSVNPAVLNVTDLYQVKFPSCTALADSGDISGIEADYVNHEDSEIESSRHPKVLVLFCGGTLIMRENDDGSLVVNDTDAAIDLLLGLEPRLVDEVASLHVEHIENIDSSNMTPQIWDKIGAVIHENYDAYDGFVITHGTDTMAFTSSALSFVLSDIGKPVVLTGAQLPGSRIETDARRNFINAVRVATLDRSGVFLVFDGDIILGSRAHKLSESKLDAFGVINWGLLGEIRIDIRFSDDAKPRHDRPLKYLPGFDNNIVVYTLFPGFSQNEIMATIDRGTVRGIVLISYGSGNLSYVYMDAIKKATSRGIAVVVTTQCLEGATLMHLYDVGRQGMYRRQRNDVRIYNSVFF
jgi:L-asparaginase